MEQSRLEACLCCGLHRVSALVRRFIPETEIRLFEVLGINLPKSVTDQFEERRNMPILLHYCPDCGTTYSVGHPLDSKHFKEETDG